MMVGVARGYVWLLNDKNQKQQSTVAQFIVMTNEIRLCQKKLESQCIRIFKVLQKAMVGGRTRD